MGKYSRVYWICIFEGVESLFTRWDFFYRFIGDLDWIFSFLFFLFVYRSMNFLVIYFIFGSRASKWNFRDFVSLTFIFVSSRLY